MDCIQTIEYVLTIFYSSTGVSRMFRFTEDKFKANVRHRELQSLPEDIHWFCPRSGNEKGLYYPDDVQSKSEDPASSGAKKRVSLVEEAERRKRLVLDSLLIFAFDADHAAVYQEWIENRLERQLSRCDVCIREYHRSRRELKSKLEQYAFRLLIG